MKESDFYRTFTTIYFENFFLPSYKSPRQDRVTFKPSFHAYLPLKKTLKIHKFFLPDLSNPPFIFFLILDFAALRLGCFVV
jgi:hypothetical protein